MLLASGTPPSSRAADWAVEVKWDGMRLVFSCDDGRWCARSRPGRDCSEEFPELAALAEHLAPRAAVLDGELVVFGQDGRPDFAALRRRLVSRRPAPPGGSSAVFVAFDVLSLDGEPVHRLPYVERRAILAGLLSDGPCWRVPDHWTGDLDAVVEVTRAHELEGVVFKRLDSRYEPGRRSGAWLKLKHRRVETFAVTGWVPARPGAAERDAVFVARVGDGGALVPAGRVELGLSREERDGLRTALERMCVARRRSVRQVAPGLAVNVSFHGPSTGPVRDAVMQRWDLAERCSTTRG